jgi:murein DD-endopeptidase MepM/ murein hydrolase activator NlpD
MSARTATISALLIALGIIPLVTALRSARADPFDGFDYPFGNRINSDGWNANGNGFKSNYPPGGCGFAYHPGEDWNKNGGDDAGAPIYAAGAGLVKRTGTFGGGRGQYIVIRHDTPRGLRYTVYVHLENVAVASGDSVRRGQQHRRCLPQHIVWPPPPP